MKTKMIEKTPIETYAETSVLIGAARAEILERFAILHESLCALAKLERELGAALAASDRNEIAPAVDEHVKQVTFPTQSVWSHVDGAMKIISSHNSPATSAVELPAAYRSDRFNEFVKGIKQL